MNNQKEYEEFFRISGFWSWVILILFCAVILGWGMYVKMMIMERPRQWDFGQLPDTPGESIYSTSLPAPEANIPYQINRVPGAQLPPGEIKQ